MLTKKLSSVQNPLVKHCTRLRLDKKYRLEKKEVLLVGKKEILEVCKKISPIKVFLLEGDNQKLKNSIYCSPEVLTKVSGLKNPETSAIFPIPEEEDLSNKKALLIIDHLQDPGNVGTLIRSALALNFDAVVLIGSVDPFNDKALRAAKGATFFLPVVSMDEKKIVSLTKYRSFYVADLTGQECKEAVIKQPFALVVGHETKGPGVWTKSFCKITIPINTNSDSLNVASAGAILMYEMGKKL